MKEKNTLLLLRRTKASDFSMPVQENIDITKGNREYLIGIIRCQISADRLEVCVCIRGYSVSPGNLRVLTHHSELSLSLGSCSPMLHAASETPATGSPSPSLPEENFLSHTALFF